MTATSGVWAHSKNEAGERHDLVVHLTAVAAMARAFAEPFGGGEMASWAGLWHDLGKFHPEFQEYLLECEANPGRRRGGPDHKGAGTVTAARLAGPLAFLVAGHHGGLHDASGLQARLNDWRSMTRVEDALMRARDALAIEPSGGVEPPVWALTTAHARELFLRMVFSCLVDADFLDTEVHFQPSRAEGRGGAPALGDLWPTFERAMAEVSGESTGDRAVLDVRSEVHEACLRAGALPPGLFRLTVPTGGGKTLAGMAFALQHARAHGLERVIVAVPFTSITEQTARVYRGIFGEGAVLEHHSAIEATPDPEDSDGGPQWGRLAAENWDAPVIVTTTVRLFESLFARKPSDCRRLHRLANSVVILDEVQTLPSGLLAPILDALGELAAHYRTSVVLCTATQPALDDAPGFRGLTGVREIVPEPARLFSVLKRVRFEWPEGEAWGWERAGEEMRSASQALAVVNTIKDAESLLEALDDPEALHLSTKLCGAHRRDVLAEVRQRLREGEPCRLVSTQVVEAGVDLDFPLVLRAVGPLDRIVQAAGRCNREGRLAEGRVVVFDPADGGMPKGDYERGAQVARLMLRAGEVDPNDPETFTRYFQRVYQTGTLDAKGIQAQRAALNFEAVARDFRLIEDDGVSVIVRYRRAPGDGRVDALVERLRRTPVVTRGLLRALQPYVVNVRRGLKEEFERELLIEEIAPGVYLWHGGYDAVRGLTAERHGSDVLII